MERIVDSEQKTQISQSTCPSLFLEIEETGHLAKLIARYMLVI
jgi:hypothetical protein